jgi:hypothetical protein
LAVLIFVVIVYNGFGNLQFLYKSACTRLAICVFSTVCGGISCANWVW